MKKVISLLIVLSAIFLTGCASMVATAVQTEFEFVPVPETLRQQATYVAPPAPADYKAAVPEDREKMLFDVIARQTKVIEQANVRFFNLEKWNDDQTKAWQATKDAKDPTKALQGAK